MMMKYDDDGDDDLIIQVSSAVSYPQPERCQALCIRAIEGTSICS